MKRIIARFENFTGRYSYNCHILEHEEREMMRPFEAVCIKGDTNQGTMVDGQDAGLFVEAIVVESEAGTARFCATDRDGNRALEPVYDLGPFGDCLLGSAGPQESVTRPR